MALINCPECNKDVSDAANTCPHCGFALKQKEVKGKKSRIFQIISLVTILIALFTPRLFLNFFVLIIVGSAIISLMRKEKKWGLSLLSLSFGLFILILPTIIEAQELVYKDKVTIVDYDWERKQYFTYVTGKVRNDGDKAISYFKIKVYYLDRLGNVLDTNFDFDFGGLRLGMSKEFKVMHKDNIEYKKIKVEVDEVKIN